MWGWRTLSSDATLLLTVKPKTERVPVLMTDGENTRSKNGNKHEGSSKADADNKTSEIYSTVKSEEITVHTIAYEVTDATTNSLLQNCASGRQRYFNARNAQQLERAFNEIADSLSDSRISA